MLRRVPALVVVAASTGGLVGCGAADAQPTPNRLVAFGHSYVEGIPGTTPWAPRAAKRLGLPLHNGGHGGDECRQTAAIVKRFRPEPRDVVVVEASVNDTRRYGVRGLGRYRACLTGIVRHLSAGTGPARLVVLADPPIVGWRRYAPWNRGSDATSRKYRDATRAIADRAGATFVDLGAGWDKRRDVAADTIHPNARGASAIAREVVAAVQP